MEASVGHALSVFMGFFAIMNPVANLPVFLGLTDGDSDEVRRKVARKSLLLTFVIILIFTIGGKLIFDLFGISLPAFRITGGILVFLIGFQMLHGKQSTAHQSQTGEGRALLQSQLEVAVTPLAIPILAGPGTIATAMNFASAGGTQEFFVTIIAFFLLCMITYLFFVSGERFVKYIGGNGIKVITQIMGLILAVIGTQMVIDGIVGAVNAATV
ncbi:MAG: MarC family protein [Gammaproteobacteria bacterium]|nr:MarC family protein [Gammaproteobacteria bacterium]